MLCVNRSEKSKLTWACCSFDWKWSWIVSYSLCICKSTPSCALRATFILPLLAEQLKFRKFVHRSAFQFIRACMLNAACRHCDILHSGAGGRVGKQLKSFLLLQSFGNCDGAVLNRNNTGDATSNDVTNRVAMVIASLWTVADVRSHTHGIQHIHPAVICDRRPNNRCMVQIKEKQTIKWLVKHENMEWVFYG